MNTERKAVQKRDPYPAGFAVDPALLQAIASQVAASLNGHLSGKQSATKSLTFEQVARLYLEERKHNKHATRRSYANILQNHILPVFGGKKVDALDPHELSMFRSEIALGRSPATANNILGLLRMILHYAHARGYAEALRPKLLARHRVDPVDVDPFTRSEIEAALLHIRPIYRQFFAFLFWTGLRPSEAFALRWKDIDLDESTVRITRARVRGMEGPTKTASSKRVIPLFSPAKQALIAQVPYSGSDPHNYVFVTKNGNPINKHMDNVWRKALQKAAIRHRPMYHLRHSFASLMLAAGETPGYVARLLGHNSLEMLYEHYGRYIPGSNDGQRFLHAMGLSS